VSRILLCRMPDSGLTTLEPTLLKKGYEIRVFSDPQQLQSLSDSPEQTGFSLSDIDLAIVDCSSGWDGMDCCQALRKLHPTMPLILLLAQDMPILTEQKRLTCGNVLRAPFTPRKVTNRAKRLLDSRRGTLLHAGELTLNMESRCVYRGNVFHRLTPRQAKLLQVFMQNAGQTLTRRFLMETVWDTDYMGDTRTLDVHVRWIRERIEQDPGSPRYLRTVRGIGYRFAVPSEE